MPYPANTGVLEKTGNKWLVIGYLVQRKTVKDTGVFSVVFRFLESFEMSGPDARNLVTVGRDFKAKGQCRGSPFQTQPQARTFRQLEAYKTSIPGLDNRSSYHLV